MQVILVDKQSHFDAVSFSFEPTEPITWQAGQSVRLEAPGFYGPEEHRFTISSAPSEELITITTRISKSNYKQSLDALPLGATTTAYDISGDFVWPDGEDELVFLGAGIGVTPFRSMLAERFNQQQPAKARLLHAARQPYFHEDFERWQQGTSDFNYEYIHGRLTAAPAAPYLTPHTTIFISGPSAMVDEVASDLVMNWGAKKEQIKRDWFTGRLSKDD